MAMFTIRNRSESFPCEGTREEAIDFARIETRKSGRATVWADNGLLLAIVGPDGIRWERSKRRREFSPPRSLYSA